MKSNFMVIIIFLSQLILGGDVFAQPLSVNVDLSRKYQTIDNFSASDCWWAHILGKDWTTANKDSIANLLFSTTKGIGLSACRFNIGAGTDTTITDPWRTVETFEVSPGVYDWSRDSGGQWFLKAAYNRGVRQFIAFVNSPPIDMTRNGHSYCTRGLGRTNLKDGYFNRYAKYLVDIIKHFRDSLGINITYVDPVNEPQLPWNGPSQEGNRASDDDIKNMVDSLYTQLQAENVSSKILIPESNNLPDWYTIASISNHQGTTYGNFLGSLFSDTDVNKKVADIFAGHSYGSDSLSSQLVQARQSLYSHMSEYFPLGYKYWVTEYCILQGPNGEGGNGRDLTMTTALNVDRLIHFDLTVANASAWHWWLGVSKYDYKDGLIYTDYSSAPGSRQNIIPSKLLWAFGNYSRYIRPDSRRISCTGADNKLGLMASAYVDSPSKKIIMVLVNVATADKKINISLSGLDSTQSVKYLTPFVTSNTKGDNLRKYPPFSVDSTYDVPAYSVVTLVGMLDGGIYTAEKPGSPELEYPGSGDTLGVSDTTLIWNSTPGAKSYEVYFAYDSAFSKIALDVSGISDTTLSLKDYIKEVTSYHFPPNVLVPNNKYYWRVVAVNDNGMGPYSETRSFFIPNNITGVKSSSGNIPDAYLLNQNFPNPFNPSTTIKYSIPKASFVTMKIYDILGREVASLVNEEKTAGSYQVNFNANNIASGIYFYRIRAGSFVQAKKMILMK